MDDGTAPLTTHLDDSTSVLLVAPASEHPDDSACVDLLTFDDPERENVLSVTFSQTPDDRLALWRREVGETLPNRAVVVDGSDCPPEGRRAVASDGLSDVSVDVLSDTAGPMELALTVGQYLGEWADTQERTYACFHSLSDLLESFDRGEVIQLINALDARFEAADAVAHFHLDQGAHDDQLVSEIRPLFDTVVEHVPGNGWTVTTAASDDAPEFNGESSALYPEEPVPDVPELDCSLDRAFDLLSEPRRRDVLYLLGEYGNGTVSLESLADDIVARRTDDGDGSAVSNRREVLISLAHYHLPKLDDFGVVEYDYDSQTVSKRDLGPGLEAFVEYVDRLDRG